MSAKEKTARKMFEELGFVEVEINESMFAIKIYESKHFNRIYFDYDKKIDVTGLIIDLDLLKAINKQVEELWGDNNEN